MMTCIRSHRHALAFHLNLLQPGKRKHANGLKHQTLPLMGDASRVGKRFSYYLVYFVFPSFLYPDARRVAPIRASVLWRGLVLEETQALMGATRPAFGKINKHSPIALITLLSVNLCLKSRRGTRRPH